MIRQQIENKKFWKIFLGVFAICLVLYFFWYFLEVRPQVDSEINSFEENISHINDPQTRIQEIANFTEEDYQEAYNKPLTLSILSSRLLFGLTNDPYFVAYFKAGACRESASLLSFYANKSGFETRLVETRAEDHEWDEIKINNRWVQVDPTIYYYYYTDPVHYSTYNDLWFDNPKAYSEIHWYEGGYSSVFVVNTNEDLSTKYCNFSTLSISCQGCDHIRIIPIGRGVSIDQNMHDEVTFNLGKMNYSILADKTIIPYFLVNEKKFTVSLFNNESIDISSIPEEMKFF